MTAFVVVNPGAAGGRTRRDWPRIRLGLETLFPLMTVAVSKGRGDTARLVRAALKEGHLDIVAVGGDGTINEAVNGFFEHGAALSPDAVLGFVASGTGSDFRRSFGIGPRPEAGIARLKEGRIRALDVGLVQCLSPRGEAVSRYFVNVASFGFSGRVAARVNRSRLTRWPGGAFVFVFQALIALAGWRPRRVRLMTDCGYDEIDGLTAVAVANGRYFGGGMKVAPDAEPGDGLFDIVVLGGVPRRRLLTLMRASRGGKHLADPAVRLIRAARLTAAPTLETQGAVTVETDGEYVGHLPATFTLHHGAIRLRC